MRKASALPPAVHRTVCGGASARPDHGTSGLTIRVTRATGGTTSTSTAIPGSIRAAPSERRDRCGVISGMLTTITPLRRSILWRARPNLDLTRHPSGRDPAKSEHRASRPGDWLL